MNLLETCWYFLQLTVGYNLLVPFILYLIFILKKRKTTHSLKATEADYAIIVTAYEQINFLPQVVDSILQLNYSNYIIYVVADKCDISKLQFDNSKIVLLRPEKTLASNIRSHFYAIKNFRRQHERLTIIDSDNLVHPNYLNELNVFFDKGYQAVQGIRAAKNLNTEYACLDAARDIYYHFYDGKLLFGAGASATLSGSGMAFTTELYKACLENIEISGAGFDKVLQFEIVHRGYKIAFAEKAIVYDEKTSKNSQLITQRARWINTWFKYFSLGFRLVKKGLLRLNTNQLLFGIILLRPPLFIFLILSLVFLAVNFFINFSVALIWLIGLALFVGCFFIALLSTNTDRRIYHSLINIPKFIWFQLVSLTKIRSANKLSVATEHFYNKSSVNS
jgi:cellulose synthase/poly-beta-1,6-N-acetylglucosamine synthase-like glycosyltransferase